jgi:hypothetical protein
VTLDAPQIMHCMLCYSNLVFFFNPKTKLRKGLIFYYKTSGITYLRKDVDENHSKNSNFFKGEMKSTMKGSLYIYSHLVHPFIFFTSKKPFKMNDVEYQKNLENLSLLIVKSHLPLQFMKSVWPKCLILHLCLQIQFHSQKFFSHIVLLSLV